MVHVRDCQNDLCIMSGMVSLLWLDNRIVEDI